MIRLKNLQIPVNFELAGEKSKQNLSFKTKIKFMKYRENGSSSIGEMHERAIASGREVRVIKKGLMQNSERAVGDAQTIHPESLSAESVSIPVNVKQQKAARKDWHVDPANLRRHSPDWAAAQGGGPR